jgi:hypothetical protein
MKKLLYSTTLLSALVITSGCVSDPAQTDCHLPVYTYDFNGRTFVDRLESLQANPDVNLDIPYIKDYTPILFAIVPIVQVTEYHPTVSARNFKLEFSLFPKAHALFGTDCPVAQGPQQIVAIDIRSSNDFDDRHPAGVSLKDLVLMRNAGEWYPKLEISTPVSAGSELRFQFYKYPSTGAIHRFTVEIQLQGGAIYEYETGDIDFEQFR